MSANFLIEFRGNHIHVQHAPDFELTPEAARELWQEIGAACSEHSCTKVLSEGFIAKRRLTITDAFQSGLAAAKEIPGLQLALCLDDYEADDVTAFFQSVASNRGVRFEVFSSTEEARQWLGITT